MRPMTRLTARTDETASTGSLTASGTAVVNFGNDVPANLLGSIVLVDTPALDGQLHTHDGQSVTFALSGGDLVGTACGSDRGHPHSSGERGCGSCRGRCDLHLFDDAVAAAGARRRRAGEQRSR